MECAAAVIAELRKAGLKGRRVEVEVPEGARPYIWHEALRRRISESGRDVGVEVDGVVFDNLHPAGVARAWWERQLWSTAGGFARFRVKEERF